MSRKRQLAQMEKTEVIFHPNILGLWKMELVLGTTYTEKEMTKEIVDKNQTEPQILKKRKKGKRSGAH